MPYCYINRKISVYRLLIVSPKYPREPFKIIKLTITIKNTPNQQVDNLSPKKRKTLESETS